MLSRMMLVTDRVDDDCVGFLLLSVMSSIPTLRGRGRESENIDDNAGLTTPSTDEVDTLDHDDTVILPEVMLLLLL